MVCMDKVRSGGGDNERAFRKTAQGGYKGKVGYTGVGGES